MTDTHDISTDEQAEREEMFGFHPDILAEATDLPRKSSGRDYTPPPDPARRGERV